MRAYWTLLFLVLVGVAYARVLLQDEEDSSEYHLGKCLHYVFFYVNDC